MVSQKVPRGLVTGVVSGEEDCELSSTHGQRTDHFGQSTGHFVAGMAECGWRGTIATRVADVDDGGGMPPRPSISRSGIIGASWRRYSRWRLEAASASRLPPNEKGTNILPPDVGVKG